MKKLSLFACALAMLTFGLSSCNNDKKGIDWSQVVENGFYVVGEATATQADIENAAVADAQLALMGAGINEATKQPRAGLYEKYVALEANKPFELVYVDGSNVTRYGAQLQLGDPYDVANGITIQIYKGEMVENMPMTVPTSGFYHIALDLNVANDLPAKSVLVSPVEWQFSNGNDVMTASAFNKKEMSWTLTNKEILSAGKYKYRWGNGWKIKVTPAAEVNIETNLGAGMKSGAADIDIARGKYDITLTWKLAGGAIEKGFTENVNKVGNIAAADYSASEIVLVGDGVEGSQAGAQSDYQNADGGWAWGNIISLGVPQKNGDVYTWEKDVDLVGGMGFKVRSNKTTDSPYVEFGKDGGSDNVTVGNSGTYTVKIVINADTEEKSITCTPKNVVIADYTNSEICVVGDAVDSNTPDAVWSWGNIESLGQPQKNGDVYTWTGQVTLKAGACKIRSINGTADDPYVEMGKDGGSDNISITDAEAGVYTFTVVIDAQAGTKSVNYSK
jgi:hypothetical protein